MKELTRNEVKDLMLNYCANGSKIFNDYEEITKSQKHDIEEGCEDLINGNLNDAETEELVDRITCYFNNDRFFVINYDEKFLDGHSTGNGGFVCYDEKTITNTIENALGFEIKKEAVEYIKTHKNEWIYGKLSVME